MIPLYLSLSGFLSYREPVELDFSTFELACIAGANGSGKSSLLDAITWALFGLARKRDDSLINTQSETAEVSFIFRYEDNLYRVQRVNPRGKTSMLEFQIYQGDPGNVNGLLSPSALAHAVEWKPLTERTLRETQACIEETLRLDYETFVNASFFLQGKADQFTQQRPGDRKRILSSILGLEVWETYRRRAAERRKRVEGEIAALDGRLHEIKLELDEEEDRKKRLAELETDLSRLAKARAAQESILENARKVTATIAEQSKLVDTLGQQLESARRRLAEMEARRAERQEEKESYDQILARAEAIEAAFAEWQAQREELERWEQVASQFREHEKSLLEPQNEINAARARLEQEARTLQEQRGQVETARKQLGEASEELEEAKVHAQEAEQQLARRAELDAELDAARQRLAEAKAENPRLRDEMDELKERIDRLTQAEGAHCPLCGQELSPEERENLIASLQAEGTELGDRFRTNRALLSESTELQMNLEKQIAGLAKAEHDLRAHNQSIARFTSQMEMLEKKIESWETSSAPRLAEIETTLEAETFAPQAREQLAVVEAELKEIGYDAAAHEAARRAEAQGRAAETDLRALEKARAVLAPLDREISDLGDQIVNQRVEAERQQEVHEEAAKALQTAQQGAPDLYAAERELLDLQEGENRVRLEVGAARQKVLVLDDLKIRWADLEENRDSLAHQAGRYKQLERAFGKDGVPALLIEQALPQIETKANEILERLSQGTMSVRFVTQAAYKDKRRDDLRETLEIQISDNAGSRDYEMFSGGEAFRVNFAIRLALSEVLAQRAGARLQTLVIDEGFGSQDAQGRQRLIEAINLVRPDFAKILVITHIDELKDVFPARIEVEKTPRGSMLRVV